MYDHETDRYTCDDSESARWVSPDVGRMLLHHFKDNYNITRSTFDLDLPRSVGRTRTICLPVKSHAKLIVLASPPTILFPNHARIFISQRRYNNNSNNNSNSNYNINMNNKVAGMTILLERLCRVCSATCTRRRRRVQEHVSAINNVLWRIWC